MPNLLPDRDFWLSKSNDSWSFFTLAASLVAFAVPIIRHGLPLTIMVLALAWILSPKKYFRENWKPILIFSAIYLFHIVAIFYTENMDKGKADLMQKLSLLLFPLLFGSVEGFGKGARNKVLTAFLSGTLIAVLMAFYTAWRAYSLSGDSMEFYMSNFSPVHHPTYLAMYMNFAAFVLLWRLHSDYYHGVRQALAWMLFALFSICLVFPASKAGFVNFIFLVLFYLFLSIRAGSLNKQSFVGFVAITTAFFVLLAFDPVAQRRVGKSLEITGQEDLQAPANELESNTARLIAWQMAIREIPNHPFGVGTGDIGDFLAATFRADGHEALAERNLNVHNSFLQIALAQGIMAMLFFIFSLLYPLPLIWSKRDWIYAFFIGSIGLQFLVECMTETQSGVVYFAFFNAMLFFSLKSHPPHDQ